MVACFEVFQTWDDEYEKLQVLLRDIVKRKREENLKMVWRINPAHRKLQARLDQMRKFRRQHEQLRAVIVRVLRPQVGPTLQGPPFLPRFVSSKFSPRCQEWDGGWIWAGAPWVSAGRIAAHSLVSLPAPTLIFGATPGDARGSFPALCSRFISDRHQGLNPVCCVPSRCFNHVPSLQPDSFPVAGIN